MAEEEEDRLNFRSKFTRAKETFPIDSLYTLIHGAKSTSSLELHIMTLAERKELISRKASASPQPKRSKASAKPRQWLVQQVQEEERSNMQEVNQKLKKLRKMERDFHEQMDRREKQMLKRKQSRQQHKKEKQKYKPNLINVEDFKQPSPPRKQSSVPSRSYGKDAEEYVPTNSLDFQDYYRETPEVKINTAYEATPEVRKQIRQMIEMQKMREKEVQSIDQDDTGKAAASIVIERIDIRAQALAKKNQLNQSKKLCEIELSHSRSENTLEQYRFGKEEDYPTKSPEPEFHEGEHKGQYREEYPQSPPHNTEGYSPVDKVHFDSHHEDYLDVGGAEQKVVNANEPVSYWVAPVPLAKQVQSIENIDPYQSEHKLARQLDEGHQQKIVQIEIAESQRYSEEEEDHHIVHHVKNRTGTEEGSELKEQIADKVEPIANRSEHFIYPSSTEQDNHVFHSQAYPHPNILPHKESKSIATDSLDFHPCEQQNLSGSGQRLQNKKSSFKKLMAENRANLVPRMAISTILNQKINEALGDIKNQPVQPSASPSASPPNLQESIIKSQVSSPSTKRKVNFKRRIVEQQLDKSHSRDSKPTFERDPSRLNRNRKLLAGFFADN